MRSMLMSAAAALAFMAAAPSPAAAETAATAAATAENALLAPWSGPYGGVPAFDKVTLDLVKPALETAMAKNLAEIDVIAANKKKPTFANTILAMEKAGEDLDRVFAYWGILSSNMSSPDFRKIQQEMSPKLAEYQAKITANEKLFTRIKAVYEGKEYKSLKPDQQRLVWLIHNNFAMNGATLSPEGKARYAEINKALAAAQTKFSNNVLSDEENLVTYI
ncbi:MAG: M3 family peptidase, partial [Parvularculaceae bacterium]|nr:M3 family peptidase [Parvularculaceae bacterium]